MDARSIFTLHMKWPAQQLLRFGDFTSPFPYALIRRGRTVFSQLSISEMSFRNGIDTLSGGSITRLHGTLQALRQNPETHLGFRAVREAKCLHEIRNLIYFSVLAQRRWRDHQRWMFPVSQLTTMLQNRGARSEPNKCDLVTIAFRRRILFRRYDVARRIALSECSFDRRKHHL